MVRSIEKCYVHYLLSLLLVLSYPFSALFAVKIDIHNLQDVNFVIVGFKSIVLKPEMAARNTISRIYSWVPVLALAQNSNFNDIHV